MSPQSSDCGTQLAQVSSLFGRITVGEDIFGAGEQPVLVGAAEEGVTGGGVLRHGGEGEHGGADVPIRSVSSMASLVLQPRGNVVLRRSLMTRPRTLVPGLPNRYRVSRFSRGSLGSA
jgi:hypothetical protein